MSEGRAGRRRSESSEIERSFEGVVRELRRHTSRELVLLIMWQQRDPTLTLRHKQSLLDVDTRAARAVLAERHSGV